MNLAFSPSTHESDKNCEVSDQIHPYLTEDRSPDTRTPVGQARLGLISRDQYCNTGGAVSESQILAYGRLSQLGNGLTFGAARI